MDVLLKFHDMKVFFASGAKGGFNQHFLMRTLLLFVCLFWCETAVSDTLKTKNFIVHITRNCPEGEVVCNNVSYTGTRLKTGESITHPLQSPLLLMLQLRSRRHLCPL